MSLDQGSSDLPLTDIVQNGSAVEFQLRLVNGGYKGTLNKEGTQMAGDWTQAAAPSLSSLKNVETLSIDFIISGTKLRN